MNNYDKAILKAADIFKNLDHEALAAKLGLKIDREYIYIPFFFIEYKIERSSGLAYAEDGRAADFNEALSLYDLLSFSKENAAPSGSYCRINSLHGISKVSSPMDAWSYKSLLELVTGMEDHFEKVLIGLGGVPYGKGDIAYKLPLFRDLSLCVCYWKEDDEFPAQMYFMYDENMTDYFRFETIWYVAGIVINRLESEIRNTKKSSLC